MPFSAYRFEELDVWKIGMEIVHEVYVLTRKSPKTEQYALSDQLKRASASIVLTIAEGSGQPTKKATVVYIQRSKTSALECVACIKVALQGEFAVKADVLALEKLLEKEYFKLVAFSKSLGPTS